MRTRVCVACLFLCVALSPAGCQRLNEERTMTLDGGDLKNLDFDPPRYEQKVTVQLNSTASPVSAYLVRADDKGAAETALLKGDAPKSALASKEGAKEITLDATIPAKTGYTLFLKANGKTEVKVKVTGK